MINTFEEDITLDNFHLLSKSTKKIIFDKHMYIIEKLAASMTSKKRFAHSKSVANVCKDLAKRWGVDENKAYLAGILHDITKSFTLDEHLNYLNYYDKTKVNEVEPILHSYSAKYFIKEKFNYYDNEVLNAIYHHTDGESNAKMAMILYIADKREPLRNLDPKLLNLAYEDLSLAFRLLKEDVKEYIKNKNE